MSNLRDGELELINRFTRRPLSENEVYAFSVVLCDNELDRDNERFSIDALRELEKLFVGVTGIMDHDCKSSNQTARIFSCRTETVAGKKTFDGSPYTRLTARAYLPVTDANKGLIAELESGIKKEVSVSCSVAKRSCSVCGAENGSCGHIRGKSYDGSLCYMTLDKPTDAYEWSFVAVPAQRNAGVIKSYGKDGSMNIEKRLFSGDAQSFTADEMNIIAEKIRLLKEKAADGEAYRRRLEADIGRAAAVALPELRRDMLEFVTKKLSAVQLEDLCNALTKKAGAAMPPRPQLAGSSKNTAAGNNAYKNI